MTVLADNPNDAAVVARQIGRAPRGPWRVARRCKHGYPSVIVSPPVLEDGTPFPTWAWLTCPYLAEEASRRESPEWSRVWSARLETDPESAAAMDRLDQALRDARAREGHGFDPCASVGVAGRRDPGNLKCLHAHVALALAGIDDPAGDEVLRAAGVACDDGRCVELEREIGEGT